MIQRYDQEQSANAQHTVPNGIATPNDPTTTPTNGTKRAASLAATVVTCSTGKKKKSAAKFVKGCRVKITRKDLWGCLQTDSQRDRINCLQDANSAWYYGTNIDGNMKYGFNVIFDNLPMNENKLLVSAKKLYPCRKGEDEPLFDPKTLEEMERRNLEWENKNKTAESISEATFLKQDPQVLRTATTYTCNYDKKDPTKNIVWNILPDNTDITGCEKFKNNSKPQF